MVNWWGFGLSFVILGVIPIWIIPLVKLGIFNRLLFSVVIAAACYWAVENGGTKRGFISK